MRRIFAVAGVFSLFVLGASAVSAEDCSPHCDYWHNYGPYDFGYIQPGLVGYPRCDARGQCSPYLVYVYPGQRHGRVTVRPVSRP
jgi:hypothetical protein